MLIQVKKKKPKHSKKSNKNVILSEEKVTTQCKKDAKKYIQVKKKSHNIVKKSNKNVIVSDKKSQTSEKRHKNDNLSEENIETCEKKSDKKSQTSEKK